MCIGAFTLALALRPERPSLHYENSIAAVAEPIIVLSRDVDSSGPVDEAIATSGTSPPRQKLQARIPLSPLPTSDPTVVRETVVSKNDDLANENGQAEPLPAAKVATEIVPEDHFDTTAPSNSGTAPAALESEPIKGRSKPAPADDLRRGLAEDGIESAALGGDDLTRKPSKRAVKSRSKSKPIGNNKSKRVSNDVRLRARPDNAAKAVAVIPAGKRVGVVECRVWCEVLYAGTRGFIYKSFLEN
jgi:hypothetical protein